MVLKLNNHEKETTKARRGGNRSEYSPARSDTTTNWPETVRYLSIPFILLFHLVGMWVYFVRVCEEYDPQRLYWQDKNWTTYYHTISFLPLPVYSLLLAFNYKVTDIDKQFLIVDGIFSLILIFSINLQNAGYMQHTYGLRICLAGIIIATLLIISALYRHVFFKD